MSKCYIFAIGGTGSRVLRPLTMLLAGGANIHADEIVPIIIDPDSSNADLTRSVKLIENYSAIRQLVGGVRNEGFFAKEIIRQSANYSLNIRNTSDMTFKRFIDCANMSRENQAFVNMLFSEKNLKSSMKVGFKGNPNIGCVVLNQIVKSPQFELFANSFAEGDKIFIISSIFGGTGASGFPLLLKTLRKSNDFPNYSIINNAEIGAVSVLPYFRVRSSAKSEIDSSTFISKSVAALAYYEDNIYRDRLINALYFVGDDVANIYENIEGGSLQQNESHLIEFIAATAIIDFCNNHYKPTQNLELGIRDIKNEVRLESFYKGIAGMIDKPLARMMLLSSLINDKFGFIRSQHFNANSVLGLKPEFYESSFIRQLKIFASSYLQWLEEMKDNVRPLDIFRLDNSRHPFDIIPSRNEKRVKSLKGDWNLFYDRLNAAARKVKGVSIPEAKFMDMSYLATDRLVDEKINF